MGYETADGMNENAQDANASPPTPPTRKAGNNLKVQPVIMEIKYIFRSCFLPLLSLLIIMEFAL